MNTKIEKGTLENKMINFTSPQFNSNYKKEVELEIKRVIEDQEDAVEMYNMIRYFFGWMDEEFKETDTYGGKFYRSQLCLTIAEAISGDYKKALPAAAAIELFHNFSLIHDDIEDNDPLRRGRKTVWNVWGIPQAINTGDAEILLSLKSIGRLKETGVSADRILQVYEFTNETFLGVIEGQYMDMSFEDKKIAEVSLSDYLIMTSKKTSILVGAASKVGAMCVTDNQEIIENAFQFGLNLGFAHQISDDVMGIWGKEEITGKKEMNDILDKKKTLALIYAYSKSNEIIREELDSIYSKELLTNNDAKRVAEILQNEDSYEYSRNLIEDYKEKAIISLKKIGKGEIIDYWESMMNLIMPELKEV